MTTSAEGQPLGRGRSECRATAHPRGRPLAGERVGEAVAGVADGGHQPAGPEPRPQGRRQGAVPHGGGGDPVDGHELGLEHVGRPVQGSEQVADRGAPADVVGDGVAGPARSGAARSPSRCRPSAVRAGVAMVPLSVCTPDPGTSAAARRAAPGGPAGSPIADPRVGHDGAVGTPSAGDRDASAGRGPGAVPDRLAAVHATELLDAAAEESFDRLTRIAQRLTGAPLAFMTVVDDVRSYWLSSRGLPEGSATQNTVEESFCQYVLGGDPLVLADVTTDERTAANPSITGMGVRAWAGFPVRTPDGHVLGSFCVVDTVVHPWTAEDVQLLEELAAIASREVALRMATLEAESARVVAQAEADRAGLLARISDLLTADLAPGDVWRALVALAVPDLGDFAYVSTVETDGGLAPAAAEHRDPAQLPALLDWIDSAGRRTGEAAGPGHVAVTGRVELIDLPEEPGLTAAQLEAVHLLRVRSALVAPVVSRGQVVAVLTIARMRGPAPYTERDRELVGALMTRAGLVVEAARASFFERAVSETMQRALLPTLLPQPDHLQLASRYQPAEDAQLVGGDWYDAYRDATGTTSLVIGDVAGHDITAAATMGQLRTMLRMAGHDGTTGPGQILTSVDVACDTLGHDVFATALVARVERFTRVRPTRDRTITWSSAGHPPPLLLHPDGTVDVLTDRVGLPLGVDPRHPRPEHHLVLPVHSTLLLYTDGLLEQHDAAAGERPETEGGHRRAGRPGVRDLDSGLARLTDLLAGSADLDLESLCDRIMATLLPAGGAADDVAVIAIRAHAEDPPLSPHAAPDVVA
jgi:serine phosphatase RsbU (regulator of sigma subunit)